jgi:hypothetical protein
VGGLRYCERQIVWRRRRNRRRRRAEQRLLASYRGDEIVTPSRNSDDVAVPALAVAEGAAQGAHLKARLPSRTGLSPSSSRRCAARSRNGPNEIGCPSMGNGRLIRSFYPILLGRLAPATDVTAWQARRCRLWVKRVGFVMSAVCPVYPKQQTFPDPVGTSHLCQNRKWRSNMLSFVEFRWPVLTLQRVHRAPTAPAFQPYVARS